MDQEVWASGFVTCTVSGFTV